MTLTMPSVAAQPTGSPSYSLRERQVDACVHFAGLVAALAAIPWLLDRVVAEGGTTLQILAVGVYSAGLLCMLTASAAYNLAGPGRRKAIFRRLDHSMIFVMIAGSYMPYAFCVLPPESGRLLAAIVWVLAAAGIAVKLFGSMNRRRLSLVFYLAMGWTFLAFAPSLVTRLPIEETLLLFAGGIIYSLGSFVHASARIPFHNAIWHGMVVIAAGLHFVAVARLFPIQSPL